MTNLSKAMALGAALAKVAPGWVAENQRIEARIAVVARCYGITYDEAQRIVLALARRGPRVMDVCDAIVWNGPPLEVLRKAAMEGCEQ